MLSGLPLAPPERLNVAYTLFRDQVEAGNVAEVTATGDAIEGRFEQPVTYPQPDDERNAGAAAPDDVRDVSAARQRPTATGTLFTTQRPAFADDGLMDLLLRQGVTVNAQPPDQVPLWQQLVLGFGPTLLLVALLVWLARRSAAAAGLGGGLGLGRSRAQRYTAENGPRTTFDDVAGIDEVDDEVREIVEFLREP